MEENEIEDEDIYTDNETYHTNTDRISKSGLDRIHKTPLHYYTQYLDPAREKRKDTPALKQGKVIHTAVFEPEKIAKDYAIIPEDINKRTNAGKEDLARFYANNIRKICITREDFELAVKIKDAIYAHPTASTLLGEGTEEEIILWEDFEYGVKCKSRLDKNSKTKVGNFIVDLKTTIDASPEVFGRAAFKYRYHVQGAFYSDAYMHQYGSPPQGFIFIAVEKKYPFAVAIYHMDKEHYTLGRNEYLNDIRIYKDCLETGEFPGYSPKIEPLRLPHYAFPKM